jgi:dTDP-4-dehydrorhamnose reductase
MKILLFGKDGQVGWELQRSLAPLGELVALEPDSPNFEHPSSLRAAVREIAPSVIVNAAAYTAVDKAETELDRARQINAHAVAALAEESERLGAWLVHYSTDYVFDGTQRTPYTEADEPRPLSVYGSTKLEGERAISERNPRHLIFRTSWVYGIHGNNFAKSMLRLARDRDQLKVVADQHGAPTSAEFLADVTALAVYRACVNAETPTRLAGLYHLAAAGETTWHEYAREVVTLALGKGMRFKIAPEDITPILTEAYPLPAARPKNSRLDTSKFQATFNLQPPHWRYHLTRFVEELTSFGTL